MKNKKKYTNENETKRNIKQTENIWIPFDLSLTISECTVCKHYDNQCLPGRHKKIDRSNSFQWRHSSSYENDNNSFKPTSSSTPIKLLTSHSSSPQKQTPTFSSTKTTPQKSNVQKSTNIPITQTNIVSDGDTFYTSILPDAQSEITPVAIDTSLTDTGDEYPATPTLRQNMSDTDSANEIHTEERKTNENVRLNIKQNTNLNTDTASADDYILAEKNKRNCKHK